MSWLEDVFAITKPVIGMCHLPALPGDPQYETDGGMTAVLDHARAEIENLQRGGVDGILISNEFSLPYLTRTEPITAIAMARVVGELREHLKVPFGVNVLWDGQASIDLAVATGARFVREVFTGVYASDFGLWNTRIGEIARHRRNIGAQDVRLLFNIVPEAAAYLGRRTLTDITRSTLFNTLPDGLCVSGVTAGASTDEGQLRTVKEASPGTPVFVNTGVNERTVNDLLKIADGAIIGTAFKIDGRFENRVDPRRVEDLMERVQKLRATL
ncbi:sgc region protein SgcQ [Streptosporangium violaceochromogenes]|nr:sgc region protein SgcQ [Streptosporangium violaceochromogenes]